MLITATMVLSAEPVAADLGPIVCEGTYSHHPRRRIDPRLAASLVEDRMPR
jgi:hypothetical protein